MRAYSSAAWLSVNGSIATRYVPLYTWPRAPQASAPALLPAVRFMPLPMSPRLLMALNTSLVSEIRVVLPLFNLPLTAYLFASSMRLLMLWTAVVEVSPKACQSAWGTVYVAAPAPVLERVKPYLVASARLVVPVLREFVVVKLARVVASTWA